MSQNKTSGFAICGSFCTFSAVIPQIQRMVDAGFNVIPIMSENAYTTDTRFGKASDFVEQIEKITGGKVLHTIKQVEPIGPQKLLDVLIVAPCTGNTLGKLACGITDTSVTMSVKSQLRNRRPVVIGLSTNDGLSTSGKNIGTLLNIKNIFFVPYKQDDPGNKPTSLVANMDKILHTTTLALEGKQLQPILE